MTISTPTRTLNAILNALGDERNQLGRPQSNDADAYATWSPTGLCSAPGDE